MPCGGPKKSPRTSAIVQIVLLFRSFEIRTLTFRNILLSSKQCLNYLTTFRNVSLISFPLPERIYA